MKIESHQPLTYVALGMVGITVLAGLLLSNNAPILPGFNVSDASAAVSSTASASVRVKTTCSMTATINTEHNASILNGHYQDNIGLTTLQTFCNDPSGYAIYAIGYTGGDAGVASGTNTVLHNDYLGADYDISTGTNTSGDTSNWAMKLSGVAGDYTPTILNGYDNYHSVPSSYAKVASFNSSTDLTIGSSLTTTYAAYIKPSQPAGTYTGQVKYALVHPSSNPDPNMYFMQDVENWADSVDVGEEVIAYDNRDFKSYTVRRMCVSGNDGDNCSKDESMLWMTQNLDLDLSSTTELNSVNTDLNDMGSGAYVNGYRADSNGVIYWMPSRSTTASINTSTGKFNNWAHVNFSQPASADPDAGDSNNPWYTTGEFYDSSLCFVGSSTQTCNYLNAGNTVAPNYFQKSPFAVNGSHGKIGNYYNWTAAVASNDSSSSGDNVVMKNSICPKNWRLMLDSDIYGLSSAYSHWATRGKDFIEEPIYMIRSGSIVSGSLDGAGYAGSYWHGKSAYGDSHDAAYYTQVRSKDMSPANFSARYVGRSIRCVSDN